MMPFCRALIAVSFVAVLTTDVVSGSVGAVSLTYTGWGAPSSVKGGRPLSQPGATEGGHKGRARRRAPRSARRRAT